MTITCGIDWAEGHHDVALVDADGRRLAKLRIDTGMTGFTSLMVLLAEHVADPAAVPVAIESEKVLLVPALQAAGLTVYPINPRAVARYRERTGQAGGKSDPGDALVLANILRTDAHLHRPLVATSEGAAAVKVLARQHQEAIWSRQATVNQLRSLLMAYFPAAVRAFPVLTHKAALQVLLAAPTPAQGRRLTRARIATLLQRSGRGNHPAQVEQILAHLHAPALVLPGRAELAHGRAARALLGVIVAMQAGIADLEQAMAGELEQHPDAALMHAVPGLGPILAARVLAEIGDDRTRFTSAAGLRAFAGTAPITKASGRSKQVRARHVRNRRLADACHWWAFAAITKSAGAREHYDRRRAVGDSHNAALRNLANRLLGRLWWCLHNDQEWNEKAAWPRSFASTKTPEEALAA